MASIFLSRWRISLNISTLFKVEYHKSLKIHIYFSQEPQAEMFLRIEGFQVEIKEINKTWDQASFIKNFKIGKFK